MCNFAKLTYCSRYKLPPIFFIFKYSLILSQLDGLWVFTIPH